MIHKCMCPYIHHTIQASRGFVSKFGMFTRSYHQVGQEVTDSIHHASQHMTCNDMGSLRGFAGTEENLLRAVLEQSRTGRKHVLAIFLLKWVWSHEREHEQINPSAAQHVDPKSSARHLKVQTRGERQSRPDRIAHLVGELPCETYQKDRHGQLTECEICLDLRPGPIGASGADPAPRRPGLASRLSGDRCRGTPGHGV